MRVDWCVSSWFRIKNTHSHTLGGAAGGRAVRCGMCMCATATKDRSQDHWACIINNEGALKKTKQVSLTKKENAAGAGIRRVEQH